MNSFVRFPVTGVFSLPSVGVFSGARAAAPAVRHDYGVLFGKFVPLFASGFTAIYARKTHSAKQVNFSRNCLKMYGIYARAIPAKMVNLKSLRNFSFYQFVCKTVRKMPFPANIYFAIPGATVRGLMNPAIGFGIFNGFGPQIFVGIGSHTTRVLRFMSSCKGCI